MLQLNNHHFPLEAVVWAAPAKDPGYTPESLLGDLRRNSIYQQHDYDRLETNDAIDARKVSLALKIIFRKCEEFVQNMPNGYDCIVFLENGTPVRPDISKLGTYDKLEAKRHEHWPSSSEIDSEMLGKNLGI